MLPDGKIDLKRYIPAKHIIMRLQWTKEWSIMILIYGDMTLEWFHANGPVYIK